MKRKSTFFRTLLVAMALLTGANAWAYTTSLSSSLQVAGYKYKAFYDIANTNVDGMCPTTGDLR